MLPCSHAPILPSSPAPLPIPCVRLQVDNSALTGESEACERGVELIQEGEDPEAAELQVFGKRKVRTMGQGRGEHGVSMVRKCGPGQKSRGERGVSEGAG